MKRSLRSWLDGPTSLPAKINVHIVIDNINDEALALLLTRSMSS
jgi:hypothetical protein